MLATLSSVLLVLAEIAISIVAILLVYIKWSHQYWKKKNVPYLEPSVPMGNLQVPIFTKDPVGVQMKKVYEQAKARGLKHCGIYMLASPTYMPLDLDYVKNIMTKDFQFFTDRGSFYNEEDDPLSGHLFAIGGTKWRNLRVKLSPTFTSGKMKHMFQTLLDCEKPLMRALEGSYKKGEPIDIKEVFACFTTNIISSCAFGLETDTFQGDSPLRYYGKKAIEISPLKGLYVSFLMSYPELSRKLHLSFTPDDVTDFFMKMVKDTVNYREKNHVKRNDFLQMLIEMKSEDDNHSNGTTLTMTELAAQCFVFFLGGYETSSTTSCFLMYQLARHQDYQQKVREEILQVLDRHEGKITYDALNEMKYMEQVINETLRMYPPLPFLTREAIKDYAVPDTDLILETGTKVLLPVLGIHMDPDYYPEPEKFDPDRFSEENKKTRHPYTHLPFGEGPRVCIGMRFGMMQLKVGLTALLKNYKFTLNKKTKEPLEFLPASFIPMVKGDLWLNLEKIEN